MLSTRVKAPELKGATDWLNVSEPLSLAKLQGKIVLLDFWTFCCVDCMHILPYLKELEKKYADVLVVIGVHSAKFSNEKDSSQIRRAIARYGIEHPVANDSRFAVWEDFWIREWPTLVLIDPDGYIVESIPCSKFPHGKMEEPIEALIAEFSEAGKLNSLPVTFTIGPAIDTNAKVESDNVLSYPGKLTTDGTRLFISDTGNHRIVITSMEGRVLHFVNASGKAGSTDGSFAEARFHSPQGLALRGNELFVADTGNHLIRAIDLDSKNVRTVAGTGQQALLTNQKSGGPATGVHLSSPWDIAWLNDLLYICMAGPHQIWYYDPVKQFVDVYAGCGIESLKDGPVQDAKLAQPSGITTDGHSLYFVDAETSAVRLAGAGLGSVAQEVKTLIGEGLFEFGDKDGALEQARLQHPLGIAYCDGRLYVCDSYNHKIKVIQLSTQTVLTLSGGPGSGNDDGATPKFAEPGGLCIYGEHLFVADTNNQAIRKINVATGTTSTLDIKSSFRLAPGLLLGQSTYSLPNLHRISSEELITVNPSHEFDIALDVTLPKGFHLNFDAPMLVDLNSQLVREATLYASDCGQGELELTLRVTPADTVGQSELRVGLQLYYCGEEANAACHVASILWETTLQIENRNGKSKFTLSTAL